MPRAGKLIAQPIVFNRIVRIAPLEYRVTFAEWEKAERRRGAVALVMIWRLGGHSFRLVEIPYFYSICSDGWRSRWRRITCRTS